MCIQGLKWEFAVIDSDQVNAFVVPGGKVVVYTGLLKLLQGRAMETQLAAVLGHEIAHVVARHSVSSAYGPIVQRLWKDSDRVTRGHCLVAFYHNIFAYCNVNMWYVLPMVYVFNQHLFRPCVHIAAERPNLLLQMLSKHICTNDAAAAGQFVWRNACNARLQGSAARKT